MLVLSRKKKKHQINSDVIITSRSVATRSGWASWPRRTSRCTAGRCTRRSTGTGPRRPRPSSEQHRRPADLTRDPAVTPHLRAPSRCVRMLSRPHLFDSFTFHGPRET